MANARRLAVKALMKINNDMAYSNITLNNLFKENDLSSEDRALTTALVYGVLDRKITLDYVLDSLIKTPFKKVSYFTAEVLRVGLYQILYMDRIPNSAAVNEAVKLIKSSKERKNAGFVNAVLRSAIRAEKLLPDGVSAEALSIRYSCPQWIVKEFLKDYGVQDTVSLLEDSLKPAPVNLRVNTTKTTAEELLALLESDGVICEKTDCENSLRVCGGVSVERLSLYKKGYFHVQDISSQKAAALIHPKRNERILDLCAAPGGKTFTMAELLGNCGEVVSCDIYENRVSLISAGAKRLGLTCVIPTVSDATDFDASLGLFDAVLCDVPCSGLGIIRRKPDIKYKNIEDFSPLEFTQYQILENAVRYLKPNGRIVYSTCTLRKKENEETVDRFLMKHPDFKLEFIHTYLPHIDGTDGFFTALLKR